MGFWCWLQGNSSGLQAVASLLGIALTGGTTYVLFITWNAIKRQAKAAEDQAEAARALTDVARQQTKAATDAAESARKQSELLSAQLEQSTAPLLVAEPDDREGMRCYKVVNHGNGVAFQIYYWLGPIPEEGQKTINDIRAVQPSTLGARQAVYLPIPGACEVFTIRYKGIDRAERWTQVHRDAFKGQDHLVRQGMQWVYLS